MTKHAVWSLSDGQFKVWITILTLANHRDNDWWNGVERVTIKSGSFVTSLRNLARDSNTTIKTVRLTLESLMKIGSITAQTRAQKYTEITLVNADKWRGSDEDEGTVEGTLRAQQGHSGGTVGALTGEGKKEEKEKKGRRKVLLANPDGFAAFWSAYPKKLGKEKAEKAWNKIHPKNGLVETILASVSSHMNTDQWREYQYIPYPATFLNGKLWEDDLYTHPRESTAQRLWREAQEEKVHEA